MRRLVFPVKTSAVTVILLAGAVYMAAEARQPMVRREQLEFANLENNSLATGETANPVIGRSGDRAIRNRVIGDQPSAPQAGGAFASSQSRIGQNGSSLYKATKTGQNVQQHDQHSRLIVISVSDRRLALLEDGKRIKTYPIAVGTRWTPSPEGEFTIINHAVDPVYRHKGKEIPAGEDNPLGDRWMGLSLKGYGIHGTNVPRSVGKAASHGCFRMAKQDVEELYARVKVGDRVIVRRERDELIARIFGPQENAPAAANSATDVQVASAATTDTSASATPAAAQ